jgi:hypothetical protein
MRGRTFAFAAALIMTASAVHYGQMRHQSSIASGYLMPPKVIVDILDAAPTPTVILSPDHRLVALLESTQHCQRSPSWPSPFIESPATASTPKFQSSHWAERYTLDPRRI